MHPSVPCPDPTSPYIHKYEIYSFALFQWLESSALALFVLSLPLPSLSLAVAMEFGLFCTRVNAFLLLLFSLSSPCKLNHSPVLDFGPFDLLPSTTTASQDFGRIVSHIPSAVLRPKSLKDISFFLSSVSSSTSKITVAARGAGHSIHGQAQAPHGIVIEMDSLPPTIEIHREGDGFSYADVSGGVQWVDLLEESLKVGLAPRSWTDYLFLSIGGTLSNAGISGQAFKYGPQISNVLQLDVLTGEGEHVRCSPKESSELFNAVLGGLGQFGIITSARILLQVAPQKVKWVRTFYEDFHTFITDQELLISKPEIVDYVEGFIVLNEHSLHSFSTAFPSHVDLIPGSKIYYCVEFVVHDSPGYDMDRSVEQILRQMSHMPSQVYIVEVSYFDFLNRVRMEEMSLRRKGMWEVPHPWLNMFVPKSGITEFSNLLMENISVDEFVGPILIYPILRDKWDANTSAVLPESSEAVVYLVGMLQSASPDSCSPECLRELLHRNRRIAEAAAGVRINAKEYLAHHESPEQWREHLGRQGWERIVARKARFDPAGILGPGLGIFPRIYVAPSL